jgi:hypothetical protein
MHDISGSTRALAQRLVRAETAFLAMCKERAGLSDAEAKIVLRFYLKKKLMKLDAIMGTYHVKHGALLDISTLKAAAEQGVKDA